MKKLKLSFIHDDQVSTVVSVAAVNDNIVPQKSIRYALKHSLSRGGLLKAICFPEEEIATGLEKILYDQIKPGDVFVSGDHLVLCYEECVAPGFQEMTLLGRVEEDSIPAFRFACTKTWHREYHLRVPSFMDLEVEE